MQYVSVMTYITQLWFVANYLRSALAHSAIQGFWGKQSDVHLQDLTDIDFSLIPRPTIL